MALLQLQGALGPPKAPNGLNELLKGNLRWHPSIAPDKKGLLFIGGVPKPQFAVLASEVDFLSEPLCVSDLVKEDSDFSPHEPMPFPACIIPQRQNILQGTEPVFWPFGMRGDLGNPHKQSSESPQEKFLGCRGNRWRSLGRPGLPNIRNKKDSRGPRKTWWKICNPTCPAR